MFSILYTETYFDLFETTGSQELGGACPSFCLFVCLFVWGDGGGGKCKCNIFHKRKIKLSCNVQMLDELKELKKNKVLSSNKCGIISKEDLVLSLSKLLEIGKARDAWHAAVHGVIQD